MKYLKITYSIALLIIVFFKWGQAQIIIQGSVKDTTDQPIHNATILLKNTSNNLVFYTFSDELGRFTLNIVDSIAKHISTMQISRVGYQTLFFPFDLDLKKWDFILNVNVDILAQVQVSGNRKLVYNNDTLKHKVVDVEKFMDRSILDVIKRLPGVVVTEDGSIYYNGKLINDVLIHGDRLMDGNYHLATTVIKKEQIDEIQIIRNHEDIEIYKDKIQSNATVINITLKDENSYQIQGAASLGIGLPNLIESDITPMILNKKLKTLNQIAYNNSGVDNSKLIFQGNTAKNLITSNSLLSSTTPLQLNIPSRNFLVNNSQTFISNISYNFNKTNNIIINIGYYRDRIQTNWGNQLAYNIPEDTVEFNENIQAIQRPRNLTSTITYQVNKKNIYLKDVFSVGLSHYRTNDNLLFQHLVFNQYSKLHQNSFRNTLLIIPQIRNNYILNLKWEFNYSANPHELIIDTSLHISLLNNTFAYIGMHQEYFGKSFQNIMSAYISNTKNILLPSLQILGQYHKNDLETQLFLKNQNNVFIPFTGDLGNKNQSNQYSITVNPEWFYKWNDFRVDLNSPFVLQNIYFKEYLYTSQQKFQYRWWNPAIKFNYRPNPERNVNFTYRRQNSINNNYPIYQGLVLTNYRSMNNNPFSFQENSSHDFILDGIYEKAYNEFLMSGSIKYSIIDNSNTLSYNFEDEIQKITVINQPNQTRLFNYTLTLSKKIRPIETQFNFKYQHDFVRNEQIIQSIPQIFNSKSQFYSIRTITNISNRFSLENTFNWTTLQSKYPDHQNSIQKGQIYNYIGKIGYNSMRGFYLNAFIYHNNLINNNFHFKNKATFLDINSRYKYNKWRTEFELKGINLLNKKEYTLYNITNYTSTQSNYNLRGRMFLFVVKFNF